MDSVREHSKSCIISNNQSSVRIYSLSQIKYGPASNIVAEKPPLLKMKARTKIVCWKCGEPVKRSRLPIRRLDECQVCRTPLHVCRMCRHYDTRLINGCRHDHADKVVEKEHANFCQFFRPRSNANLSPVNRESNAARFELDELFGGENVALPEGRTIADNRRAHTGASRTKLDELFGTNKRKRSQ